MKTKNSFIIKFKKLFGYRYLINLCTREIHDLKNTHKNCRLNMLVHKKFIKEKELEYYLKKKYNGCRFCFKSKDKN